MTEANGGPAGVSPTKLDEPLDQPDAPAQDLAAAAERPAEPTPPQPDEPAPTPNPATARDGDQPPITFQSMADRLTLGLLASVIGAVLVFVSAFLTWSTVNARASSGQKVAGATTDSLGVAGGRLGSATLVLSIAALALITVMLLPATKPWAWKVLVAAGGLITLLALIDLISIPATLHPKGFTAPEGVTVTFHRSTGPGVWFTVFAGVLVAAGAYVHHIRPVPFRSAHPAPAPKAASAPVSEPAVAERVTSEPAAQTAAEPDERLRPRSRRPRPLSPTRPWRPRSGGTPCRDAPLARARGCARCRPAARG